MECRSRSTCVLIVTLSLAAMCFACAAHVPGEDERVPSPDELQARAGYPGKRPNTWFYGQRLSADRQVPVSARSQAIESARQAGLGQAPGSWQNVGPLNVGGRVTALAVDPNNPDRIWIGTAAGGVFLTESEGASFAPVFDDQAALSIGALVAHPTDSDTLYVGTGEDNGGGFSYDGEGVFKTVDGGLNWTSLGLAEVRRVGKMAVDPTDGDRIFVAAGGDWFNKDNHRGIYRSIDGGQNWTQVLFVADDAGGIDVVVDPGNPNRVFASIWQRHSMGNSWYIGGMDSGIWRSTDGGDSWTRLTTGLPTATGRIGLAIAPTLPDVIYANVIGVNGSLDGIYRSADGGDTWNFMSNPGFTSYSYYFSQIRVDPSTHKTVYALDLRMWRSLDSGASFSQVGNSVHVDWHDLVVESGGRMVAGTDGGFYVSQNSGVNWTHAENLPITQFYDLGIDHLDPARRFAGAQDNGTVFTPTAGLDNWAGVLGGDGLQCEVDYTNSLKVYASAQSGNIFRSIDGGQNFTSATSGITGTFNWNAPVALDPVVPSTLYTGTDRVFRSVDSAVSWSAASPQLTLSPVGGGLQEDPHLHDGAREESGSPGQAHLQNLINNTITVVQASPVDNDVIWAGTDDGNVWVTDDGGVTWDNVNPVGSAYWVTDIAPDAFDAQKTYLAVTGYRQGDKLPYVRVTEDLGQTWSDISGNLPQVPVSSVLADTEWIARVFVGTDVGVYVSDQGGNDWSAMRDGMPYAVVMDLVRHDPTSTLYAGTHARSIFSFALTQLGDADGDGDMVDNNSDCALDDPGAFAPPGEVTALSVGRGAAGEANLVWSSLAASAGTDTRYDLATGPISDLRVSGTAGATDLVCGAAGTTATDAGILASGEGAYYIVRGRNVCGLGVWGDDSGGTPRNPLVCP